MAEIKQSLVDAVINGQRQFATVGNNRTIRREKNNINCHLHMHPIVVLNQTSDQTWHITMDPCGWRTTTTRNAMKDFLKAFGVNAGVSFAKGEFSMRVMINGKWTDLKEQQGVIQFSKESAVEGKAIF